MIYWHGSCFIFWVCADKKIGGEKTDNMLNEFRSDNTEGYSSAQLAALNTELALLLHNTEPYSEEWYMITKNFADEVSRRGGARLTNRVATIAREVNYDFTR